MCEKNAFGESLPEQTQFHPVRSILTDKVSHHDLVLSAAITTLEPPTWTRKNAPAVKELDGPRSQISSTTTALAPTVAEQESTIPCHLARIAEADSAKDTTFSRNSTVSTNGSDSSENSSWLSKVIPGPSLLFLLHLSPHLEWLTRWILHSNLLIGKDLIFDILYLRHFHPRLRAALNGRHLILDVTILNYLDSELRPERTLKAMGPILGTHDLYAQDFTRFSSPRTKEFQFYNATDSHRTLLNASELARRNLLRPNTWKFSSWCLHYFSDLLWDCIRICEAGICMDRSYLERLETSKIEEARNAYNQALTLGLTLEGKGSNISKDAFLETSIAIIEKHTPIRHKLRLTDIQQKVSWSDTNREILREADDGFSDINEALSLADQHSKAQKIVSSFTYPLLRNRRTKRGKKSPYSSLLHHVGGSWITHPKMFLVPSPFTDQDSDEERGQQQARPTIVDPPAQTFPPIIRKGYCSRYPNGVLISGDINQGELRVAGLITGEPTFIHAYQNDIDLHDALSEELFPAQPYRKPQGGRSKWSYAAKQVNFGILYDIYPTKLQEVVLQDAGIHLSLDFCWEIIEKMKKLRPVLLEWQAHIIRTALADGILELPFTGHSRYFMGGEEDSHKEIINFPIQATCAITLNRIKAYFTRHTLPSLTATKPRACLWLNHYDALKIDCRDQEVAEEVSSGIRDSVRYVQEHDYWAMCQDHYNTNIPLKVEIESF